MRPLSINSTWRPCSRWPAAAAMNRQARGVYLLVEAVLHSDPEIAGGGRGGGTGDGEAGGGGVRCSVSTSAGMCSCAPMLRKGRYGLRYYSRCEHCCRLCARRDCGGGSGQGVACAGWPGRLALPACLRNGGRARPIISTWEASPPPRPCPEAPGQSTSTATTSSPRPYLRCAK